MQRAFYAGLRTQTSSAAGYGFSRYLNSQDFQPYQDLNAKNTGSSEEDNFRMFLLVCFLFVLLIIFACICCLTFMLTRCSDQHLADASYLTIRTRFYWANISPDGRQPTNTGDFRTRSERMEYIANNMKKAVSRVNFRLTLCFCYSITNFFPFILQPFQGIVGNDDSADIDRLPDSNSDSETDESQGLAVQCVICLEKFRQGDMICTSCNNQCIHEFHETCITTWLLHHQDCPSCRRNFFQFNNRDDHEKMDNEMDVVPPPYTSI
jgi:hypothetical protein